MAYAPNSMAYSRAFHVRACNMSPLSLGCSVHRDAECTLAWEENRAYTSRIWECSRGVMAKVLEWDAEYSYNSHYVLFHIRDVHDEPEAYHRLSRVGLLLCYLGHPVMGHRQGYYLGHPVGPEEHRWHLVASHL